MHKQTTVSPQKNGSHHTQKNRIFAKTNNESAGSNKFHHTPAHIVTSTATDSALKHTVQSALSQLRQRSANSLTRARARRYSGQLN
jgi:hypothetical protein